MDPTYIAPVLALKHNQPTTIGELRKLLGFVSYYSSFIPNFSRIAKPSYDLMSNDKTGKGKQNPKKQVNRKVMLASWAHHTKLTGLLNTKQCCASSLTFSPSPQSWVTQTVWSHLLSTVMLRNGAIPTTKCQTLGDSICVLNSHCLREKLPPSFREVEVSYPERFWDFLYYSSTFRGYTDNNPFKYVLSTAKLNAKTQR